MRNEMNRYAPYQVYLLLNGKYFIITDAEPATKLKKLDSERNVYGRFGTPATKQDAFDAEMCVIEDDMHNISIAFDISKNVTMTVEDLTYLEAAYLGLLTDDTITRFGKMVMDINKY